MLQTILARHSGLVVDLLMTLGVFVLVWGMPRANRYRLPWRWRVGVLSTGLGLIFWPSFYAHFGHLDLEMVWIPIWFATFYTFAMGIGSLLGANMFKPLGGVHNPYDFGWIMRPPAKNPSPWDLVARMNEDFSNPFAATLRRVTSEEEPNAQDTTDRTDLPKDESL